MQVQIMIRFALVLLEAVAAIQPRVGHAQPAVQPITVEISLSPQAGARMAALHEGITVSAWFSGDPTPASRRLADETGQVGLATENRTVGIAPFMVIISGAGVTEAKMRLIRNRNVKLLINVFSARRVVPDNILNCDIFEGAVSTARGLIPINCKLITEGF